MTKEQLLAEVDDLVRTMPAREAVKNGSDGADAWLGRALAAIERWSSAHAIFARHEADEITATDPRNSQQGYRGFRTLLQQMRADLQMELRRGSVVVAQGQMLEYFDEVRKFIESARTEVFFVDPYLEADFVSRYLPHVPNGVRVRLLGRWRPCCLRSTCSRNRAATPWK